MLYRNIGTIDINRQTYLTGDQAVNINQSGGTPPTTVRVNATPVQGSPVPEVIEQGQVSTPEAVPAVTENTAAVTKSPNKGLLLVGGAAVVLALLAMNKKKVSGIGKLKQKDMILLGGLGVLAYFAFTGNSSAASTVSTVPAGVVDTPGVDNNYKPYTAEQVQQMNNQLAQYGGATNLYQAGRNQLLNTTTASTPGPATNP